ncbi:MAG TPA: hypothetical protein VHE33_09720 [Acidobacteriaceae bacterium]|nr:hypothetical protein [Acidobacteriaceae bacterium]
MGLRVRFDALRTGTSQGTRIVTLRCATARAQSVGHLERDYLALAQVI